MERDNQVMPILQANMNFNSHAHVERDTMNARYAGAKEISTHTLTWSVTLINMACLTDLCISTHTLTWSVTGILANNGIKGAISTHTLTWSVTPRLLMLTHTVRSFQLTRSRGA